MELLERDSQWRRIDGVIESVRAGEGAIVLVGGEAGIGKTSFVTAVAESVRPTVRVLWGACDPLFTPRPLGPVYDIAMGGLPHLLDPLNSGADWLAHPSAILFMIETAADVIWLTSRRSLLNRVFLDNEYI